jgi:organic hydroperoxide reductase OsmC/OhrA
MSTTDNGVNVQALLDAREVLAGAPDAAQFTWRASSKWENGVHSTTSIQNFFGLGAEQTHKSEAVFDADHPEVFAASDNGITPIEYLLVGLASCLTAGVASVAQNRGIQLRSVESTVEGNHDIEALVAQSQKRSAVFDALTNPTEVTVEVA